MESGILGFGICDSTQGIRNPDNSWNPDQSSIDRHSEKQYLECGSKAWNPESKTVLQGANYVNKSHVRLLLVDKKNVTDILNFIKILIFFFSFHVVPPKTATSAEIMYVTFFQS